MAKDRRIIEEIRAYETSSSYRERESAAKAQLKNLYLPVSIYVFVPIMIAVFLTSLYGVLTMRIPMVVTPVLILMVTMVFFAFRSNKLEEKRGEIYAASILQPMLDISSPGARVTYDAGINQRELDVVTPGPNLGDKKSHFSSRLSIVQQSSVLLLGAHYKHS